jgi:hypothetical protein
MLDAGCWMLGRSLFPASNIQHRASIFIVSGRRSRPERQLKKKYTMPDQTLASTILVYRFSPDVGTLSVNARVGTS